ncbi:MAG TPA: alpha/beta hydrolase [Ornithinibacter sp.]|nr:alpha/beta hydrolase [Ornithinibacter sp.]
MGRTEVRQGTFPNGMDHATWGTGPRTLLYLAGGPGSSVPAGRWLRMSQRWFQPFTVAGYTVWYVTRRRHMPQGHSVADVADDYAQVVADELGGQADLVVGVSFGGMVAQHLAARHGDRIGHVALVAAAAEVSPWGKEVDVRLADAVRRGDVGGAGAAFSEYLLPGGRSRWVRRLAGPLVGRSLMSGKHYPPSDLVVEAEAELAFDARPALPGIRVPVVLLCGDRDRFFLPAVVAETAALIPDCAVVTYAGRGHGWVASTTRVPVEVLAFVDRTSTGH